MAKVNWALNDTVLPADMNQIGTEINQNTADITTLKGRTDTVETNITNLGSNKLDKANPSATGNLTTTGRLISQVAQGTAPLGVTSSTVVTNLNSQLWNGFTVYSSPAQVPSVTLGTETMEQLATNMANNSIMIYRKDGNNASTNYPENLGLLYVIKKDNFEVKFDFERTLANGIVNKYYASYRSDVSPAFTGWQSDNNNALLRGRTTFNSSLETIQDATDNKYRWSTNSNGRHYLQVYSKSDNTFKATVFDIQETGTVSITYPRATYLDPSIAQMRNIHQGRTAPSASLGAVGDIYIEW